MKRDMIKPKVPSSFEGVPKDLAYVMRMIINNQVIRRLLYHTDSRCLDEKVYPDNITDEQTIELIEAKQICALPKIKVDLDKRTYITVNFNNYIPNEENPFYRDHTIEIRILVHFDNWNLQDNDLRAYRIAGEIDSMLNGVYLSGIGQTLFMSGMQDIYDEEYGGLTLNYLVVRGSEDKDKEKRPMI